MAEDLAHLFSIKGLPEIDASVTQEFAQLITGSYVDLQQVRDLARAGRFKEALHLGLLSWSHGMRDFSLYEEILSALAHLNLNVVAELLLQKMQNIDQSGLAEMYIGALKYRNEGLDAAVRYYRTFELGAGSRPHDKNGAIALRNAKEVLLAAEVPTEEPPLEYIVIGKRKMQATSPRLTLFTVADSNYLRNLANSYLNSVSQMIGIAHVHYLLVNCADAEIAQLRDIALANPMLDITCSIHKTRISDNLKSFCINVRFLALSSVIQLFDSPVVLTDLDFVFQPAARFLLPKLEMFDFGYVDASLFGAHLPWELVHGNFVYFSNSPSGKRIAKALCALTQSSFSLGENQTHFDQSFLLSVVASLSIIAPKARPCIVNRIFDPVETLYLQSSSGQTAEEKRKLLTLHAGVSSALHIPLVSVAKPATQSSISKWSRGLSAEEDASFANNGDLVDELCFCTAEELDPWWQVDLLHDFSIFEIRLFNRKDQAPRLRHFSILLAEQQKPNGWIEIYRKDDDHVFGSFNDTPLVVSIDGRAVGRYVRVRLNGIGFLHFRECEVRGLRRESN